VGPNVAAVIMSYSIQKIYILENVRALLRTLIIIHIQIYLTYFIDDIFKLTEMAYMMDLSNQ
jgi:hypothetical protein